ncbi:MAG TPA: biotin carboxylase N-terminal domain-containing protein [Actinomycetota bacterium]|nr:biotin carboxylase N-terminal domain-containing protein [Actinomycetota bacterium]
MFSKLLIANRGEIAVRVARTCKDLGVATVAVYSDADEGARHTRICDEAVHLPGTASSATYLNIPALVGAAESVGASAVHPGYGFLSENAAFAAAVMGAGLVWVGPPPDALRAVGDKISARRIAESAGVPIVPGLLEPVGAPALVADFAAEHGFPVAVKAAGGGGGRGLKVAHDPDEIEEAFTGARREALAYFDDDRVYVERYLTSPKHLEVQIVAPAPDQALWLGVRDCSLQRRHQKLIEETPPARLAVPAAELGRAAVALSSAVGYVNAGTVEMLVDQSGFYFLEVNARLQVEHTVTEEIFGVDLVAAQLRIAAGDQLGFTQSDLEERGHAIECRINAEDPARGFIPTPGWLTHYIEPSGPGVRVDSGFGPGDEISGAYDSLLAKVICTGSNRDQARARMLRALDEMEIEGVASTVAAQRLLLQEPSFVDGSHSTTTVEASGVLDSLIAAGADAAPAEGVVLVEGRPASLWNPAMAASATAAVPRGLSMGDVIAPMQGTVLKLWVSEGDAVKTGDPMIVLEAMKMESTIDAARDGNVRLHVDTGTSVSAGQLLAVIE